MIGKNWSCKKLFTQPEIFCRATRVNLPTRQFWYKCLHSFSKFLTSRLPQKDPCKCVCVFVNKYLYVCMCVSEKAMATHSSTLAWEIPWMEEPGGLQSTGSRRVRHDWATSLSLFTLMHWRRKWQPTPVFLPGESRGRGACWAAVYGVTQSRTRLTWLSSSSSMCVYLLQKSCCLKNVLLHPSWNLRESSLDNHLRSRA